MTFMRSVVAELRGLWRPSAPRRPDVRALHARVRRRVRPAVLVRALWPVLLEDRQAVHLLRVSPTKHCVLPQVHE